MTEDEFLRLPEDGYKYELVEGEAKIVSPVYMRHDAIVMHVGAMLHPFTRGRGTLSASSAGFRMKSGNIRCPDISFTLKERLPGGITPNAFGDAAPDLCIEVISVSEDRGEMIRKVEESFESSAKQVWHLFPEPRRLRVYTSPTESVTLEAEDEIEGGDLLPGFHARVAELFEIE
ncbi:MAG: Uma2 family endonuclease [Armatimonadetes bacterium]|nr:Uma2 family endonuclease [Armatimonadota bacterium]